MSIIGCMIFKDDTVLVYKNDNSRIACKEEKDQEYVQLRSLIPILTKERMRGVLVDFQKFKWNNRTRFCGVCGTETEYDKEDNCKICKKCNERYYPSLFPAVIVSITKGDKILLAHNKGFPGDMYSVIAGFVDPGESLEDCVKREVYEEVGLEVRNIKYFGSQNWGFTSSLMIAFTAEYKSGNIKIDEVEIDSADWFDKNNLPEIPPEISIARTLIDNFVENS